MTATFTITATVTATVTATTQAVAATTSSYLDARANPEGVKAAFEH